MISPPAPTRRRDPVAPPDPSVPASRLIVEAARSLSADPGVAVDVRRCRAAADSLSGVLAAPDAGRSDLLAASPYAIDRFGIPRTLIEMVESVGGDDAAKLRLIRLLLRSLDWLLMP